MRRARTATAAAAGRSVTHAGAPAPELSTTRGSASAVSKAIGSAAKYPEDGGQVWLAGYSLVDPDTGRFVARDDPSLAARGLRVAGVAGAGQHHAGWQADERFAASLPELPPGDYTAYAAVLLDGNAFAPDIGQVRFRKD